MFVREGVLDPMSTALLFILKDGTIEDDSHSTRAIGVLLLFCQAAQADSKVREAFATRTILKRKSPISFETTWRTDETLSRLAQSLRGVITQAVGDSGQGGQAPGNGVTAHRSPAKFQRNGHTGWHSGQKQQRSSCQCGSDKNIRLMCAC